jgi:capsid assembly protease
MTTSALAGRCYAMERSALEAVLRDLAADRIVALVREHQGVVRTPAGAAVVPVHGVLEWRKGFLSELFGGSTSTADLITTVRALAADDRVKAILLDVDSPGGEVEGMPEAAAEIRAARKRKPVIAVASPLAASAAFWLACQATEFIAMGSGQVGSVGVFGAHEDLSALEAKLGVKVTLIASSAEKVELSPHGPLSDPAREHLQRVVNGHYRSFVLDLALGRGVSLRKVEADFGGGRMLPSRDAVAAGMADRVGTLDGALQELAIERGRFIAEMDTRQRQNAAYRASLNPRG